MNRLPPELLGMIAAALARTNKTLHSICNSRIYQAPVLGNDRIVRKWARFYLSKVNPWTVSKKCTNLWDLVLPESISFFGISESETTPINGTVSASLRHLKPPSVECSFVKLLFTPILFQTSLRSQLRVIVPSTSASSHISSARLEAIEPLSRLPRHL
ncbi:hypothetical protein JCM3765_006178 [Sporobolomyces pararoseus]